MTVNDLSNYKMKADNIHAALEWRYAVKLFDKNRKLSDEEIRPILEAIRMAPSSYGLQHFDVYVVTDETMKVDLRKASYNQPQLETSSHVLIFVAKKDISENTKKLMSFLEERGVAKGKIEMMQKNIALTYFIRGVTRSRLSWASEQAHVALGVAVLTAAQLGIDSCPMGGFSSRKVAKVLRLGNGQRPVAFLVLGYRSEGDAAHPKYRLPLNELVKTYK